jgi:DNA-binding SARP family transcriptional activator
MRRLRLFGVLRVGRDNREFTIPAGKPRELLAYLALHRHKAHRRDALIDLLYPDAAETQARHSFSDTLHRLRQAIGADWLAVTIDTVALRGGDDLWVDVWEFEVSRDWAHALDLYTSDLLEDVDAEWVLAPRMRLQERQLLLLEQLCLHLTETNQLPEALSYAHRWTQASPLSEEATETAVRLYMRLGRPAAALRQYEQYARAMADELHAGPSLALKALAESIRAEYEALADKSAVRQVFVGRRHERALLVQLADQALAGRGAIVFVEGETGVGKTRLLEAASQSMEWRGFALAWGRARMMNAATPCAPLDEALQNALAGPRADQLRARLIERVSMPVMDALATLIPRLRAAPGAGGGASGGRLSGAALPKSKSDADLFAGLAECLLQLALLKPQVIFIDDAQWAEASFWATLQCLAPLIAQQPLLLVISYRGEEIRQHEQAWTALRELDRQYNLPRVVLSGLSAAECLDLAREMGYSFDAGDIEDIHQRTRGYPLFVMEWLQQPERAITTFQSSLEKRCAELAPSALQVLQAGAVLGREFGHGAWQAVAGADVLMAIPRLVAGRFIQETEHGYVFQHDLIHQYIYDAIAPPRKIALHERVARVMGREHADPAIVAWHFEQAQQFGEALHYWCEAGDRAALALAHHSALEHYTRAFQLLDHVENSSAQRLALLSRRQRILGTLVRMREWQQDLSEIESLAPQLGDSEALLAALESRMTLSVYSSDINEMMQTAQHALALAQQVGNRPAEARISNTLGTHLVNILGQTTAALPLIHNTIAYARLAGDKPLLVTGLCTLSLAQRYAGQCHESRDAAQHALKLTRDDPELAAARAQPLQALGCAEWHLGHWLAAAQALGEALPIHWQQNNQWAVGETGLNYALVNAGMGQHEVAAAISDQLMAAMQKLDLPINSAMKLWLLALVMDTQVMAGDFERAEKSLTAIEYWMSQAQESRSLLMALQVAGRLRLLQQRFDEAEALLARAVQLWQQGPTIKVEPLFWHAIAAHLIGEDERACESLVLAEQRLHHTDYALCKVLAPYARFQVLGSRDDLRCAYDELQQQASQFEQDTQRAAFLERVPLHRIVQMAWSEQARATQVAAKLARTRAPWGKPLTEQDHITILWTPDAGEEDAAILRRAGPVALRHHRLQRMIAEANAQGAAPTHVDLAQALNVNPRTIARDLAATGQKGTRKDKPA